MNKFLAFTIFLFSFFLSAQEHPVKHLDISMGLSNNSVNAIYQDKDGYMWFGTYDGLNRYDGYDFKIFRNEIGNKSSLGPNFIHCVEGDKHNNIWVGGTTGGSVYTPSKNTFTQLKLTHNKKEIKDAVGTIKKVNNSLMLVGCETSGLVAFKDANFSGVPIALSYSGKTIYNYHVTAIEAANKNYCWVFIKNYGLYRFWIKKSVLEPVTAARKLANAIKQDKKGRVWLGADDGLYLLNTKTNTYSQNLLPTKSIVTSILDEHTGQIFVATDGAGVYHTNASGMFVSYEGITGHTLLKSDAVWGLYEDKDGNKWFGTLRGGVSMIGVSNRYFNHIILNRDNTSANYTLSFCEDKTGNVWIGTDGAGIRIWNRKKNTFTKLTKAEGLSSNFVPGIVCDYTNTIWVATWNGGISRIDPDTKKIKYYNLNNPFTKREDKNAWLLFEDSKKNLWVSSTREGTLFLYNRETDRFEGYNNKLSEVLCLAESADGLLWAGTFTELWAIDKQKGTLVADKIGYPIRCILEDKDNVLWIGTSDGGLLKYNRKTRNCKRYTVKNGLPGNTILQMLRDKSGNLWMSTYNGLSRFDVEHNVFRNFSVSDGLQSKQFSYRAALELSTGEFLFGGINGFNIFQPEGIKDTGLNATLLLSDVLINNNSVKCKPSYYEDNGAWVRTMRLPYDQTNLSLDFIALDYENSDKINYAYCLDGWDEHWNVVGKTRRANYARLPEGRYTFKVKASNSYGKWGKETALLIVNVLPPWYRSWWAYMLYTLAGAGLVIIYLRYNKNRERLRYEVKLAQMERAKEKELAENQVSMFTYISHEFRTPLALIINPIKSIIKQQSEKGAPIPELSTAHRNARRLLSLVDQLLLFRRAEGGADELLLASINLNTLCDEVYQCFIQQSKEQNISYALLLPETTVQIIGDYEKIEISLFNLVSNAFKYTPQGGQITISLTETNAEAHIAITDSGCGIADGEREQIFEKFRQVNSNTGPGKGFGIGLYIVKHFMEKHKGTVSCMSTKGQGATFSLAFVKGYDHFADLPINDVTVKMSELVRELLGENLQEPELLQQTVVPITEPVKVLEQEIVSDKKSILIIDDNAEIRNYLIQLFSNDYIVYSADNGLDGFKLVKKHLPDLVLSDIAMEGMTGLELCKKIKESDGLSHTLVILLTAATSQETQLQGISDGADDYITKPFDNDILKAKVETLIRNRSQLRNYYLDNITLRDNNHKVPSEYGEFLKKCIQIVEANLNNENFTIKQFSKDMGMSHSGLYTKIKAISGQTLNGFIRSVRLRHAAVLMLTEDIQIAQAASRVGFEDKKHFREQFVKLFGMTPSEYIKKYRHSFNKDLNVIQR